MQQYLEQIQAIMRNYTKAPVPVSALEELLSIGTAKVFSKGDLIIAAGEESSILYILLRGLVRKFYLDAAGSDITHMFLRENTFFSTDFIMIHRPSLCCFEAVEECLTLTHRLQQGATGHAEGARSAQCLCGNTGKHLAREAPAGKRSAIHVRNRALS